MTDETAAELENEIESLKRRLHLANEKWAKAFTKLEMVRRSHRGDIRKLKQALEICEKALKSCQRAAVLNKMDLLTKTQIRHLASLARLVDESVKAAVAEARARAFEEAATVVLASLPGLTKSEETPRRMADDIRALGEVK